MIQAAVGKKPVDIRKIQGRTGGKTVTASKCYVSVGGKAKLVYDTGNGTWSNPYKIWTVDDFLAIEQKPSASYVMMNDLYFYGKTVSMFDNSYFTGSLDGNGYVISRGPIIGNNRGTIRRVRFVNSVGYIYGTNKEDTVGELVQYNEGLIEECYGIANDFIGGGHIGGIVGWNKSRGIIRNCMIRSVPGNPDGYVYLLSCYNDGKIDRCFTRFSSTEIPGSISYKNLHQFAHIAYKSTGTINSTYCLPVAYPAQSDEKYWKLYYTADESKVTNARKLNYPEAGKEETFIGWDFKNIWEIWGGEPRLRAIRSSY